MKYYLIGALIGATIVFVVFMVIAQIKKRKTLKPNFNTDGTIKS